MFWLAVRAKKVEIQILVKGSKFWQNLYSAVDFGVHLVGDKFDNLLEINYFAFISVFLTFRVSVSPEPLLSLNVDKQFLLDPFHAAIHGRGVDYVEEDVHEPGAQERHPPHCHHPSQLEYIKMTSSNFYFQV